MISAEISTILSVVAGYVVTSMFFFKYPTIIHKKKNVKFLARHISHRGGAGEYYENTLTAFKRVITLGTDMLEIDCQFTKDRKVVVAHDANLFRLTGINMNVSCACYDELPNIKIAVPVDFEPGKYFSHNNVELADRRIPLLEDVFKNFSEIPINIDVKRNDSDLIKEISRLINIYKREERCVWGNVAAEITEKCFKQNPEVNLLFSRRKVIVLLLCYYIGLLPFIPLKETHLEICLPSIYNRWPQCQKYRFLSNLVLKIAEILLIRKSLFLHLRRRGIQVYLWVLNENWEFERAFDVGVTGVMTDYPTKLAAFIKSNQHLTRKFDHEM